MHLEETVKFPNAFFRVHSSKILALKGALEVSRLTSMLLRKENRGEKRKEMSQGCLAAWQQLESRPSCAQMNISSYCSIAAHPKLPLLGIDL